MPVALSETIPLVATAPVVAEETLINEPLVSPAPEDVIFKALSVVKESAVIAAPTEV